jgi:hygromycin-B 7''-O-kinase
MSRLLPAISSAADFYRERSRGITDWQPALDEISRRHGIERCTTTRFADGESPVFALGDGFVVKLVPRLGGTLVRQEIDLLTFLAPYPHPPAPRLVGHGDIEDWQYLLMTRIAGIPLQRVWPDMPPDQRLRLAVEFGRLLASLHALPQTDLKPGAIDWSAFCHTSFARWTTRPAVARLSPALMADGPRYFQANGATVATAGRVLLHGDLAPVNLLVRCGPDGWAISGMIDFGNAMRGDPWFDLTAASVLLQPGDRTMVHALLGGYVTRSSVDLAHLRPSLMVNTLIHPLGDIAACLDLVPGSSRCQTSAEVALRFWPD